MPSPVSGIGKRHRKQHQSPLGVDPVESLHVADRRGTRDHA